MKLISHRGNLCGPNPKTENDPDQIMFAIHQGFDVEIDVRTDPSSDSLYLGHDDCIYEVSKHFLSHPALWCHAKDYYAFVELLKLGCHCFYHDKDHYTITSRGMVWGNINSFPMYSNYVINQPEKSADNTTLVYSNECKNLYICTDYPFRWQDRLK